MSSQVLIIVIILFIVGLFLYSGYSFMNYRINNQYGKTSGPIITAGYYIFYIFIAIFIITCPVIFLVGKGRR